MFKRFRFVSPGEVYVGVVRGKDDRPVRFIDNLLAEQKAARDGKPMLIHEAKPGHVSVYCEVSDEGMGPVDYVDLRNPELKILECV